MSLILGDKEKVERKQQQQQQIITADGTVKSRTVALLPTDPYRPAVQPRRAPDAVLDEDSYVDALQHVIERDFYPDLPRIRVKLQWMEAKERGDVATMRAIQQRYGGGAGGTNPRATARTVSRTPAALMTPSAISTADPSRAVSSDHNPAAAVATTTLAPATFVPDEAPRVVDNDGNQVDTSLNLDRFVASYTSEDNASYQQLSDRAHQKFRERNSWVEEAALKNQLLLESAEAQERGALRMWNYTVRNRLMYYPDAIEPDPALAVVTTGDAAATTASGAAVRGAPKAVVAENTRFVEPLPVTGKRRRDAAAEGDAATGPVTDAELIARRRARLRDDEGPDALTGDDAGDTGGGAARVRGYGFVSSPSPAPGVDASPIVTWGEIGSTPMRLSDRDAGDTADAARTDVDDDDDERWLMAALAGAEDAGADGAPSRFRMQPTPERDELLHSLAATLAARKRRESARRVALSSASTATSAREVPLSPAAKRLMRAMTPQRSPAASSVGSLGDALRRTYQSPAAASLSSTPTSLGARSTTSKPIASPAIRITPRRRADATPQRQANALLASIAAESGAATTSTAQTATTITDNLL